ncbi:MAG: carbonic anhydrase [Firmicutes bacterium]|nr:carbonic anhydrase [Bacillota bacterium]
MDRLIEVNHVKDIFPRFRHTPIETLFESHNLGKTFKDCTNAEIILGMCPDHQQNLRIPENFAFIIHPGETDFRSAEFEISYAISVCGVKAIALIAHSNCGFFNIISRKNQFIEGLVNNGGWQFKEAEEYFLSFAAKFNIKDKIGFIIDEAKRIQSRYPKIPVAPLYYQSENKLLYQIHTS